LAHLTEDRAVKKWIVVTLILIGGVVAVTQVVQAQSSDRAGSVGALFLKMDVSPRVAGMGKAYVGISDDISGIFLNPVSIVDLKGKQVFLSEMEYMVDMRAMAGVFSFPLPENLGGRMAVHYTGFFSGDMKRTTALDIDGDKTNENFTWNDIAVGVTYARAFTDKFSVGVGAKYVRTEVLELYSQTVAFDVGTMYKTGFRNLRLGMSTTNFGPDMKFRGSYGNTYMSSIWLVTVGEEYGYYALPISFQVGLADELFNTEPIRLTAAIDYSHPNDLAERIHLGAEFAYAERFFLRGGFFMDMDKSDIPDPVTPNDDALDRYMEFRFGAGIKWQNLGVDYAWQSLENLESVHRIGLSYGF
jgi:hypothetical protein